MIQTILGDTGSITGNIVTIYANNAANNSGSSVKFVNSGTISTLNVTDVLGNTIVGSSSGNLTLTGAGNTFFGSAVGSLLTTGQGNCLNGSASGPHLTSGDTNTFIGYGSGFGCDTGDSNTCIGASATCAVSGSFNTIIGTSSGQVIGPTASYNVYISNIGDGADNNTIRIGQRAGTYTHTKCYIAGIVGVTNSNAQLITINSSTDQLGVTSSVTATGTDVTGATQQLVVGNGYATDRGGGVTYTLPATATFWDQIIIVGKAGITTITPNANQQIVIGALSGSIGPGGTAVGTNAGDCITLRCITGGASSVWRAESYVGNWTLN